MLVLLGALMLFLMASVVDAPRRLMRRISYAATNRFGRRR